MNREKWLKFRKSGFTIPLVMCVLVLLFVIGGGMLALGASRRVFAVRNCAQITARSAADAAVTEALYEMNRRLKANLWDNINLPAATDKDLPNTDATFSYNVTGDLLNGYTIESVGRCGISEKRIRCNLELQGPFEHAILTKKALVLKSGTLIQGYNSLDPADSDIDIKVVTKSTSPETIVLNNGVQIDGDVAVGVGGSVDTVIKDLGATTQGRYSLLKELDLPLVSAPQLVDKAMEFKVKGHVLKIGPEDSGQYHHIELENAGHAGVIQVEGGDVILYVKGDILLGQDCEIVVKEGASLTLFLNGDMIADNNAGFNVEGSPSSLKIFGTSTEQQNFILKAKGEVLGAVYAPNANVTVYAQSDLRGSITAGSFEFKAGGNFYYDEALSDVAIEEAIRFVITRWTEWEL